MSGRSSRLLAVAALALVAGACGSGGGTAYPKTPQEVAVRYLKTNDASKCALIAPALIEELTDQQGEAALRTCERNVARVEPAKDVRIREAETKGDTAMVETLADGQEGGFTMRRIEGRWRIVAFSE